MIEDLLVELQERGGIVGRALVYRARLHSLSPHSQALLRGHLPVDDPQHIPATAPSFGPVSALFVHVDSSPRPIDTSTMDPDDLEELLGELRSAPVVVDGR